MLSRTWGRPYTVQFLVDQGVPAPEWKGVLNVSGAVLVVTTLIVVSSLALWSIAQRWTARRRSKGRGRADTLPAVAKVVHSRANGEGGWSDNGHYLMDANAPITLTPFSFISFAWAGINQPRVSPFRAVPFPFLKHRYLVMITRRGISR